MPGRPRPEDLPFHRSRDAEQLTSGYLRDADRSIYRESYIPQLRGRWPSLRECRNEIRRGIRQLRLRLGKRGTEPVDEVTGSVNRNPHRAEQRYGPGTHKVKHRTKVTPIQVGPQKEKVDQSPDEASRFPGGGVSSGCDSASCLPTGGIDGRPPLTESKIMTNELGDLNTTKTIENRTKKKIDPGSERSLQDEGSDMEMSHGQEKNTIIPETGKSNPVGGVSNGCDAASCLPTGVIDGRTHTFCDAIPANEIVPPVTLRLPRPKPFKGDGRSFLRCSLMSAKIRLGSAGATEIYAMTDVCSNTGLIDLNVLKGKYPEAKINPMTANITGIGSQQTVGWTVIPIWIDCKDKVQHPVKVQIDVEFHAIRNFSGKVLIGLDAILDYGIDISVGSREAKIEDLTFPLFCPPSRKFKKLEVKSSERVIIPGETNQAISIKSSMIDGIDYNFNPYFTMARGLPTLPQIPKCVLNSETKLLWFTNSSPHPMELQKGQTIGEAEAVLFGSQIIDTGQWVDFADIMRPRVGDKLRPDTSGTCPPKNVLQTTTNENKCGLDDILTFDAFGKEDRRPPRSIPEEEIHRIAANSIRRTRGERFATEDEGEQAPIAPMPDDIINSNPEISDRLSERQRTELRTLIEEFSSCFSDGSTIGHVDPNFFRARIELTGPLPPPQQNRPVGPGKRAVIDETMDSLLGWDVIESSNSPTASAVVLVWQNEKWRFCIDFRPTNRLTKGDAYPMLRSDYVFSALADKRYFSMLDAVKGYHQMEIDPEDRHKTAFISHRGLYQYKRLPFGLRNAPAMFQRMMDKMLGSLRWQAALVYIDDVIVFSASWADHLAHLRTLFRAARKIGLKFHLGKCRFAYANLELLGMGLSRYGLHTIEQKVKAISDLAIPITLGEVHRLIGMFSYYRNFIPNFSKIAAPLNALKRNNGSQKNDAGTLPYNAKYKIDWTPGCQSSFDELRKRLSTAPILAHPKFDGRPFIMYTDSSAIAIAAVLCQVWTHGDYNLHSEDSPETVELPISAFTSTGSESSWTEDYIADPIFRQKYRKLKLAKDTSDDTPERKEPFRIHEDKTLRFLTIQGERICLPANRIPEVLKISHDILGHFGTAKTYERIASVYYRPGLSAIVAAYVRHCPKCIINKTTRSKMPGSLAPIDAPTDATRIPSAFEAVNMDLIVALPKSNGFDAILVIIDRFTKTGIFTPTITDFTAESIAEIVLERMISRGFLPSKFITDRDPRLIMSFWKTLCRRLKIDHRKTAAFHAQADGAAERMNQILEVALRNYISPRQNNWSKHLYLMELAYNTSKSTTTGFSPYELLYAQPQNPVERILRPHIPPASEDFGMDVNESTDDLLLDNATRLKDAQQSIVMAMSAQKEYYDRRHGPMPNFKVGDYASIRLDRHPVAIIKRNKLTQQKLPPVRPILR